MTMSVADVLGALHDLAIVAMERGVPDVFAAITGDPLVGPVLFVPGRRVTATDFEAVARLIRASDEAIQDPLAFNRNYILTFSRSIATLAGRYAELGPVRQQLVEVLERDYDCDR